MDGRPEDLSTGATDGGSEQNDNGGGLIWLWALLGVGVAGGAIGAALHHRRRRHAAADRPFKGGAHSTSIVGGGRVQRNTVTATTAHH